MTARVPLISFILLLTVPAISTADDWMLTPGKGSIILDESFSDQMTAQLNSRGLDWGPWTALEAVDNPDSVPTAGKQYASPDHKFSVHTVIEDSRFFFVIKNTQTGKTDRLESDTFPVLAVGWSLDSKTLVAVVHEPMTSYIKIIHWNGSSWDQFEIDPPAGGDDDKFHVVGWQFKAGYLEATYIVDHRAENGASLDLYRCTFHVDPDKGNVSHGLKTAISQKDYIALRNGGN